MIKFKEGDKVYDCHPAYKKTQIGTIMGIMTGAGVERYIVKFPQWPHWVRRTLMQIKHVVEPSDLMKEIL